MADSFFPRTPGGEFERSGSTNARGGGQRNYSNIYRTDDSGYPGANVPLTEVITEQPMQTFGSQVSGGHPNAFGRPPVPQMMNPQANSGVPLPGFDILEGIPAFKIHNTDFKEGYTICKPGYKIYNATGDLVLKCSSDTLFCPFDSKQKHVYIADNNGDCIFHIKFTPSVCECDSEEKRCFAVFSPVFESPFGAVLFEAGQLKYSLRILNALEAETFTVQYMGNTDITIKGADGAVVAIINVHNARCRRPKFSLTLMEEVSSANKALFIACVITLDLVTGEKICTKCVCCAPLLLGCLAILGLYVGSLFASGGGGPKIHPS